MLDAVIRKEYKNHWEKRVALTPEAIETLKQQGCVIDVETSEHRIFSDEAYKNKHITIVHSSNQAKVVIGIKEPPLDIIQSGQIHLCFSHTIKGQPYNMPLLKQFLDKGATLIDYETIVNERGARTIAFGRFAGIAGMSDALHVFGRKLLLINKTSDLSQLNWTHHYQTLANLKQCYANIQVQMGEPVQIIIIGTGNVGKGAEEVCRWLKLPKVDIESVKLGHVPQGSWFAMAKSSDLYERLDGKDFEFDHFVAKGKSAYRSSFDTLLGKFNLLVHTPYWTEEYPKHLCKNRLKQFQHQLPWVISDISCDLNGSLESTQRITHLDDPVFTYHPDSDSIKETISWEGPTTLAIDNLPCELSLDASEHFSSILHQYMPNLLALDTTQAFDDLALHPQLYRAMIVYKGKLTPNYKYLQKYLSS